MMAVTRHEQSRHYTLRCTCGYEAKDDLDLDEHIIEMQRYQDNS